MSSEMRCLFQVWSGRQISKLSEAVKLSNYLCHTVLRGKIMEVHKVVGAGSAHFNVNPNMHK